MLTKRSEDGTEELLLSEGVLRRRHGDDERVLADVGLAVGQEVGGGLGHLRGTAQEWGQGPVLRVRVERAQARGQALPCAWPGLGRGFVQTGEAGARIPLRTETHPQGEHGMEERRWQGGPESPSSRVSGELGLRASGLAIAL